MAQELWTPWYCGKPLKVEARLPPQSANLYQAGELPNLLASGRTILIDPMLNHYSVCASKYR